MKTTADATISVDQLIAKFKTWQLYTQLLEYIRQGKNRIRLVASCRWAFSFQFFLVDNVSYGDTSVGRKPNSEKKQT